MDVMVAAGEVVTEFVGEKDGEERGGEGQAREKQLRMMVGERKYLEESIEGGGLIVGVGGGKMGAGKEGSEEREKK